MKAAKARHPVNRSLLGDPDPNVRPLVRSRRTGIARTVRRIPSLRESGKGFSPEWVRERICTSAVRTLCPKLAALGKGCN